LIYDAAFDDGGPLVEGTTEVYSESDKEFQEEQELHAETYRVFDFKGNIKVISVPFIEGYHGPQNKEQMLSVARLLKRYHDNGFVHGDIRLLNIVFATPAENSRLIDWDFGGKENESLVYPRGYKQALIDGRRRGVANKPITANDDAYALYHAFTLVLRKGGDEWDELKELNATDFILDKLVAVLETLLKKDNCVAIPGEENLVELLEMNTKLASRSDNHPTGEGDPVSPNKANLNRH
jgi:serine/threonine protein kinase